MISLHTCPLSRPGILAAGGMNVVVLNFAKELAKLGWQVDVFTRQHEGTEKKVTQVGSGLRVVHLPVNSRIEDFAGQVMHFWKKEGKKPDFLYAHYYLSGLAAKIIKEKMNLSYAVTFHTLGAMKKIYVGENNPQRIKAEKAVGKEARLIITTTPLEKRVLLNHYHLSRKKIVVVLPGVDSRLFHPRSRKTARQRLSLPKDKKIILFVGRFDPVKGVGRLLRAVQSLSRAQANFTDNFRVLLIGGNTRARRFWQLPEVVKIRRTILRYQLDCCVKFLGFRPHRQLVWYYAAADVVVLPSFYESFGLVALEALACGAAVLATKVGGLRFLIKDGKNGLLFANHRAQQLAEKLWRLLDDESLRQSLGKEAVKLAKAYRWELSAKKVAASLVAMSPK